MLKHNNQYMATPALKQPYSQTLEPLDQIPERDPFPSGGTISTPHRDWRAATLENIAALASSAPVLNVERNAPPKMALTGEVVVAEMIEPVAASHLQRILEPSMQKIVIDPPKQIHPA